MAPYVLVLALGIAALVQVSLLPVLSVAGVYPNITLVVIVVWALLRGARAAVVWALIAGLWLDLLSGRAFGGYMLGLVIVAYVAGLGSRTVYRAGFLLALAMVAAATIVQNGIQMALLALSGGTFSLPETFVRLVLPEIVYNGVVLLAIYPVLSWVNRTTGQEQLPLE